MTEDVKELAREVALMTSRRNFSRALSRIEGNQKIIYERLDGSVEGIQKEHAQLVKGLLADYRELFQSKIRLVDLHHEQQKQLTRELKTKLKSYNTHIRQLKKTIREADIARKFFDFEAKRLNKTILEYNEKVTELNELLLKVREGGEKNG